MNRHLSSAVITGEIISFLCSSTTVRAKTATVDSLTIIGEVYDASAFALPEGSMLDGLVRQLPGAELKSNGDIYINGEKIDYLTLNGRDFFT